MERLLNPADPYRLELAKKMGATVALNGNSFTIIGVLPRDFNGVSTGDHPGFYVPMSAQPQLMPSWPAASPVAAHPIR